MVGKAFGVLNGALGTWLRWLFVGELDGCFGGFGCRTNSGKLEGAAVA